MSRDLENMKAQFVAVNGIRKVSCVVSSLLLHITCVLVSYYTKVF